MKFLVMFFFTFFMLYGVEKDAFKQVERTPLLQLNIENMQTFDFLAFEKEYELKLAYCVGSSICFFKAQEGVDLQDMPQKVKKYGKATLYRPYRLKLY